MKTQPECHIFNRFASVVIQQQSVKLMMHGHVTMRYVTDLATALWWMDGTEERTDGQHRT